MDSSILCSKLCLLSYLSNNSISKFANKHRFTYKIIEHDNRRVVVFTKSRYVYVAFCGSLVRRDIRRNLRIQQTNYNGLNVHSGFVKCLYCIERELDKYLDTVITPTTKLIYCGHSRGGSVATIYTASRRPNELYTFGSPKAVCNKVHTSIFNGVHVFNYVVSTDIVPYFPPHYIQISSPMYLHVDRKTWYQSHKCRTYLLLLLRMCKTTTVESNV